MTAGNLRGGPAADTLVMGSSDMKKILVLLIVILLAAGAWFVLRQFTDVQLPWEEDEPSFVFESPSPPPPQPSAPEPPPEPEGEIPPEEEPPPQPVDYGYYYDLLPQEEQRLYVTLLEGVRDFVPVIELDYVDTEIIWEVFGAVMNDNPGLFWVNNELSYTTHTLNNEPTRVEVFYSYNIASWEELSAVATAIDGYLEVFMGGVTPLMADVDKVLYAYEYIINNTDYVLNSQNDQNIQSVFLTGQSVCTGYAKATQLLLGLFDIPCTIVTGYAEGQGRHAWNLVELDGDWYYLDTTWGDPITHDAYTKDNISYDYFLVTDEEIRYTHQADAAYPLPACSASACNYYNITGRMFDSYDFDGVSRLILADHAAGRPKSTFRFSSAQVFATALDALIQNGQAFEILAEFELGYLSYSTNEDLSIFTINF